MTQLNDYIGSLLQDTITEPVFSEPTVPADRTLQVVFARHRADRVCQALILLGLLQCLPSGKTKQVMLAAGYQLLGEGVGHG